MRIKQGRLFPPTAIGTGYFALFICGILYYNWGNEVFRLIPVYLLVLYFLILQFSTKSVLISQSADEYEIHISCLFFSYKKKKSFREYHYLVYKKINQQYKVQQGAGPGISVQDGIYRESYYSLAGKLKKNKEEEIIIRGKSEEILQIIKSLPELNLKIYMGAPKPGYEIKGSNSHR